MQPAFIPDIAPTILAIDFLRYVIGAGLVWLLVNIVLHRQLAHRRILDARPHPGQILHELSYSASTVAIFAATGMLLWLLASSGWVHIYDDVARYGWAWWWASLALIVVAHDAWLGHTFHALCRLHQMTSPSLLRALLLAALTWLLNSASHAQPLNLGFTQLTQSDGGNTTVFYPTSATESHVTQGPFELSWAKDASPARGNGRLIVISHGSGGSPWVHTDLARELVARGFVVALPQHQGDNYLDPSSPGPDSWTKRPHEVSKAIDLVAKDPRLSAHLSLDAIGVFGGSAGGHTALSLAGGEWSSARFRDHCDRNIEIDFSSCVGFTTLLSGNWLDGIKTWVARCIISWRFSNDTVQRYLDPRVKASVAMVPFAADFVPESLAEPRVALGLVIAAKDVNQIPALHVEVVRKACEPRCQVIMYLPDAGHGAMLSPMPPLQQGSVASRLLSDPPSFDRTATLPVLHSRIAEFFSKTLLSQ